MSYWLFDLLMAFAYIAHSVLPGWIFHLLMAAIHIALAAKNTGWL